jgi:ABC-type multidrug transport system fused ATPase/permease subunit
LLVPPGPLAAVLRRYRGSVLVILCGGVLGSLLEGVGISLLVPLIATMMPGASPVAPWLTSPGPLARLAQLAGAGVGAQDRLAAICGGMFALIVLKAVVQALTGTYLTWINGRIGHDIRTALSQRLHMAGYPFFLDQDRGRLVAIMNSDSWRVFDAVRLALSLLIAAAAVAVFGAIMLLLSWKMLAIVAVGTGAIRVLQLALVRHLHALSRRLTTVNAVLANRVLHAIDAVRPIRLFGQETAEHSRFVTASDTVRRALFAIDRAGVLMPPAMEVGQAALFIGVLLAAVALDIRLPVILGFLVLLYRAEPPSSLSDLTRRGSRR